MNWQIEHSEEGYHIFDETGKERGRYRSANELATHLAFALRELDTLRHQIAADRFFVFLEWASAEVATWPTWKQKVLG